MKKKIEYSFENVENDNYKLICFASYIYLERYIFNNVCDYYKNLEKSIFIRLL